MKRFPRTVGAISLALALALSVPVEVQAATNACTQSDAETLFQHGVRGFDDLNQGITGTRMADLVLRCQYRLYLDGETLTFHENDVILGAIFYFWTQSEMEAFGFTRAEAIDDMELIGERVLLAPVEPDGSIGALVEQQLRQRPYANWYSGTFGEPLVYTHIGLTMQLPVGDYISVFEQTYPGEPDFVATVRLHIIPAET